MEGVPAWRAGENPRRARLCRPPPAAGVGLGPQVPARVSSSGAAGLGRGQLWRRSRLLCARPRPAWRYGEGRRASVTSPAPSGSLSPNSLVCTDGETEAQSPTAWAPGGRTPPLPQHPVRPAQGLRGGGGWGVLSATVPVSGADWRRGTHCPRGQQGPGPESEWRTEACSEGPRSGPTSQEAWACGRGSVCEPGVTGPALWGVGVSQGENTGCRRMLSGHWIELCSLERQGPGRQALTARGQQPRSAGR